MPPCELVERKMRFLIGQRETHDDVLTADLAPKPSDDHFCGMGPRRPSTQTKYHSVMEQLSVASHWLSLIRCRATGVGYPDCHM